MMKYIFIAWLLMGALTTGYAGTLLHNDTSSTGFEEGYKDTLNLKKEEGPMKMANVEEDRSLRYFSFQNESHVLAEEQDALVFDSSLLNDAKKLYHENKARLLMAKVKAENRFVNFLDASALIDLPIGIMAPGGKEDYAVLIDSLVITPDYAYLTAYLCIPIPQSDRRLVFRGENIRLNKEAGITGDARMFLVNDVPVPLFGENSMLTIRGGSGHTYALWDCNGFKEIGLSADVEFSRNWLLPVKGDGRVKSQFRTNLMDWNDLVVTVNLDPFTLPSLKGVEFHTRNVVFDFSDKQTPELIRFPAGYQSTQFLNGDKRLWRGFYMDSLKVLLPEEFEKRSDKARISFRGEQLLIDSRGFSGNVSVMNLFTIKQGTMNGWDYSLDSLGMSFTANELKGAGFAGQLSVPIGENNKPFQYTATIHTGPAYTFTVTTKDTLTFDVWKAQVKLRNNSYLDVQVSNGKFRPKAVLTGSMNIQAQTDDMSLFDIEFEELSITTEAPYLDAKAFSFGSEKLEHTLKGFPISISRVGFKKKEDTKAVLFFNIGVHFTGESDGAFSGDATFDINSELNTASRKWKYTGVSISEVGIDFDGGSYRMKGRIKLFEADAIYGKGYNGTVQLYFDPGFELNGTALFGRVEGYRYWYTDAFVGFPSGIPFCGFLAFYGFGGGMYHNMEQVGFTEEQKYNAGKTLSGIVYKPNKAIRYGLKATVQIGLTSSKETFNGDATFEVSFNRSGGLKRVSLIGNAYLFMNQELGDLKVMAEQVKKMSEHQEDYGQADPGDIHATHNLKPPGKDALISGHMYQYYDFENDVLHGEMEMYVDIFGVLKGIGPNGLAGWSVVHYSREEWFIYIGTPDRRVGLKVLGMMSMDGYFMTGDQIPGSPPPPAEVSRILGNIDLDYMRDENALGTGKGVAFGASFKFDTGDKKFMMFYGRFAMGAGFDVMIKNYGSEAHCKGSGDKLGINGWYANGQVYAFVEGKIGIRVKLFFKTKKIEILRLGAAVVFQAKLPNPVWMRGIVGGRYSVLGGLVKGHCKFELEIGKECKVVDGSVLEGLNVISDLSPASGTREVEVFVSPQAVFNLELDKEFQMVDVDDKRKSFRIKLDRFVVKDGNAEMTGAWKWNQDHTVVVLENPEVFPPHKELIAEVKVIFEEKISGQWKKVELSGKEVFEEMKTTFTTGEAPDYIPRSNIAYTYPLAAHVNFYPGEYPQGYIKLKKGQSYLFNASDTWMTKVRFNPLSGEPVAADISYANNQISYNVPVGLQKNTVYTLELVNILRNENAGSIDANVKTVTTKVEGVDAEISNRKAEGTVMKVTETLVYKNVFKTSMHFTFADKMDRMKMSQGWIRPDTRGQAIHVLGANLQSNEYFDNLELQGSLETEPLISISADLTANKYYQGKVYPLVYDQYTTLSVPSPKLQSRDLSLGIPPVKATYISQTPFSDYIFSEEDLLGGMATEQARAAGFHYELCYYMKLDYYDLQTATSRYFTYQHGELTERRRRILETPFPVITQGDYQVQVTYTLPGIHKVTTTKSYFIHNPFK